MIRTKNLSFETAEAAARAASIIGRRGHLIVQARNGRYKWGRVPFLWHLLIETLARRVWYVSVYGEVVLVKGKDNA